MNVLVCSVWMYTCRACASMFNTSIHHKSLLGLAWNWMAMSHLGASSSMWPRCILSSRRNHKCWGVRIHTILSCQGSTLQMCALQLCPFLGNGAPSVGFCILGNGLRDSHDVLRKLCSHSGTEPWGCSLRLNLNAALLQSVCNTQGSYT